MRRVLTIVLAVVTLCATAKTHIEYNPFSLSVDGQRVVTAPTEGLWSVATDWSDGWMSDWHHASPERVERVGEWSVVHGKIVLDKGTLVLRDSYREVEGGLIECRRRFEWQGSEPLEKVTLSVRLNVEGQGLMPCLPGILYYGNKNGAKVDPNIIPVYNGTAGEFAIFEEHRYPMPFAMLENGSDGYAAALHTTPSPVRGAVLSDQWWSLGVEAFENHSQIVLYSGAIGYNGQHGVAKALQRRPMPYTETYITLEPQQIIEKQFFVEVYPISRAGSGFQRPIYTSLDLHKPYNAERFPTFEQIVRSKYEFAKRRWIEFDSTVVGFNMYDTAVRKDIVMGWCGQADSPGFSLQALSKVLNDSDIEGMVQRSLDYLSTFAVDDEKGIFVVGYNGEKFHGGDPVSCGQAMYNFAQAIALARKNRHYDRAKWEAFLKRACDAVCNRILSDEWNPKSTAEGFYIAPLAISSKLFREKRYLVAARKAAELFAERHLEMNGCYWGGTLDATCEDKEGSWAAFQGFLELYERTKESKYLEWAKHAMDVCLSYVVVWDIPLPAGRLADFNFKTTGWSVVSAQNQHIDVYGVLFAPEVYKMGKLLKDNRLCRLAEVMFRSCAQLTDPYGSQGEQIQQTNFAQRGDMSNVHKLRGGYAERWTVFWITAHFLNSAARFKMMER